ncbi:hypothetical protein [Nocardia vinacea]|uniref:hypothetical protein n=1 Tax=Nocardia vinacea TaxID=96468 RepID=UPI0012F6A944|nr:hypothetical protein [Nocardia vinacea]
MHRSVVVRCRTRACATGLLARLRRTGHGRRLICGSLVGLPSRKRLRDFRIRRHWTLASPCGPGVVVLSRRSRLGDLLRPFGFQQSGGSLRTRAARLVGRTSTGCGGSIRRFDA